MKYTVEYDYIDLVEIEITDPAKATSAIKEMVEFWGAWEDRLAFNKGDYMRTWLKQLGRYIFHHGKPPANEEGWYDLDGTYGIKLISHFPWEHDIEDEDMSITEEA